MHDTRAISVGEALSDEALEWIIRLHNGRAGRAEHQAWALWRAQSDLHAAAAREAEAVWTGLGGAIDRWQGRARLSRRAVMFGGGAAVMALAGWQGGWLGRHLLADHQTATAERRSIRLRDGTAVQMNAQTALTDGEAPGQRGAELIRGQAAFTVTAASTGPFQLQAGVLTAQLQEAVMDVDLRLGSLLVTMASGSAQLSLPAADLRLGAGQRLRISDQGTPGPVETIDATEALAWQRGKLIFDRRPLGDLASELERYRGGRVLVMGEALAARQLTGVFDLSEPDAILQALPAILPVRVNRMPLLTVIRDI